MTEDSMQRQGTIVSSQSLTNVFMRGVYLWMSIGLLVTAVVSWIVSGSQSIMYTLYNNSFLLIGLFIAQLGLVFMLSAALNKLSAKAATAGFIAYSTLTGIVLAPIFLIYTSSSIASTFLTCAGMFGAMSLYGLITKRDLTGLRAFLFMGLIGIIIATLINMIFVQSTKMDLVISVIGILVFLGLTAYDTQKLRNLGESAPHDDPTAIRRATIYGALKLYLDFINLFLYLLRFLGDRR